MSQYTQIQQIGGSKGPVEYKCWTISVSVGTEYGDNEIDMGSAFKAKYGAGFDVPAISGFILASGPVRIKFNDVAEDAVLFDTVKMGHIWTFTNDDVLKKKIFFENPASSPAEDVTVQVFASGSL